MTHQSLTFEICTDSIKSVQNAAKAGAHRVELCDNLLEGGTTPSMGMIEMALAVKGVEVFVIIRPRGGDFFYSEEEFRVMELDVIRAREAGAHGIVSGLLLPNGDIDVERTARLMKHARGLPFTFHRAFDVCRNPAQALNQLIDLGVNRLLTSGAEPTAIEGKAMIAKLVQQAGNQIIIMPGSGINPGNIAQLIESTGAREFHFSARKAFPSKMTFANPRVSMSPRGKNDREIIFSDVENIRFTILAAESYLDGQNQHH